MSTSTPTTTTTTTYPYIINNLGDDDGDCDGEGDDITLLQELDIQRGYDCEDLNNGEEMVRRKQLKKQQQRDIIKEPSSQIKYDENSVITTRQLIIEEQQSPFKNRHRLTLLNRRLYNMQARLVDLDNTGILAAVRYDRNDTDFQVNPSTKTTDDTSTPSSSSSSLVASSTGIVSVSSIISRRGSFPSPVADRGVVKKLPKRKESPPPTAATTTITTEQQEFQVGDRVYVPKSKLTYYYHVVKRHFFILTSVSACLMPFLPFFSLFSPPFD
jgi:hypothetical protein